MKNFTYTQKIIIIVIVIIVLMFLFRNSRENLNSISSIKTCLTNYSKKVYRGTAAEGEPDWSKNLVCRDGSLPPNKQQIIDEKQFNYFQKLGTGTLQVDQSPKTTLQTLQKDATREKCQTACDAALFRYYFQQGKGDESKKNQIARCIESCVGYTSKCTMILPKIGDYDAVVGWVAHQSDQVGCE